MTLQRTLQRVFGLQVLRPAQQAVVDRVLAGHSTLAVMPTGSGKSLCYQLPALMLGGLTVVISPLIALMKDQCESLRDVDRRRSSKDGRDGRNARTGRTGSTTGTGHGHDSADRITAAQLHSGIDAAERSQALAMVQESGQTSGARFLFTTPERIGDTETLALLQRHGVALLVVDEAHCIAQWGHGFRPAFAALRQARRALGQPPVLALTATATADVQAEICQTLGIPRDGVLCHGIYRDNLELAVEAHDSEARRLERIEATVHSSQGSTIVYAATVREATRLHGALQQHGAVLYHGRLPARARGAAQDAFMRGEARVMVATNAFGMGIDKPDIRLVVHAQMPASLAAYYQECGRAGRDGQPARCVLMFREGDRAVQQFFAGGRAPSREQLAAVWHALRERTPQAGWVPSALAAVARLPVQRTEQVLAALAAVRALARTARGGVRAAANAEADHVVQRASSRVAAREEQARDGLEAMLAYAKGGRCRWSLLMAHFDAAQAALRCQHCDVCQRLARLHAEAAPQPTLPPTAPALRPFNPGQAVLVRRFGRGLVRRCDAQAVTIEFEAHGEREIDPAFVSPAPPAGTRGARPAT